MHGQKRIRFIERQACILRCELNRLVSCVTHYQRKSGFDIFAVHKDGMLSISPYLPHPLAHCSLKPIFWTQVDTSESTREWCFVDGASMGLPIICVGGCWFGRQVLLRKARDVFGQILASKNCHWEVRRRLPWKSCFWFVSTRWYLMKLELKVINTPSIANLTMDIPSKGSHLNYGSCLWLTSYFTVRSSSGVWAASLGSPLNSLLLFWLDSFCIPMQECSRICKSFRCWSV